MGQSVQFRGVSSVVEAYRSNAIGPVAIRQGRNIIWACSDCNDDDIETGCGELQAFLTKMKKGGTEGRYDLCVYRLGEGEEIHEGLKPSRSFCFSLVESDQYLPSGPYEELKSLREEVAILKARLDDDEGEEKKVTGIGSMLNGLLELPEVRHAIGMAAVGFMSKIMPMNNAGNAGQKVAGIETAGRTVVLTPDQQQKAQLAINRLSTCDALLGDHLQKIADIAENDPVKYSMLAKML